MARRPRDQESTNGGPYVSESLEMIITKCLYLKMLNSKWQRHPLRCSCITKSMYKPL